MSNVESWADLSPDLRYRYDLTRRWAPGALMLWVMLNPSTADGLDDDPTIRRCCGYARREGLAGIRVVNLFGLRSTSPAALRTDLDPVGPSNDITIAIATYAAKQAGAPVVCAWGSHGMRHPERVARIRRHLLDTGIAPVCLGRTLAGQPVHPLYQPAAAPFVPYV